MLGENLVDQAMLNIDAAGVRAGEVADEFLGGRQRTKRIGSDDIEKRLGFLLQVAPDQLSRVTNGLPGEDDRPPSGRTGRRRFPAGLGLHQSSFLTAFASGSAMP